VAPPLFAFQVNSRDLVHFSYSRYLENKIRDAFGFEGTPIRFVFREKEGDVG
jgi:GTP-binding protein